MRTKRPANGFTLIELLVVIGIIALLIGILVPVASYVKMQGYRTRTAASIDSLRAASEAYYQVFSAYPGPLKDSEIANNSKPTGVGNGSLTGNENAVLGLCGGLTVQGGFKYDPALVGRGPQQLIANGKSYGSMMDTAGILSPIGGTGCPLPGQEGLVGASSFGDTSIPEFMDNYPDRMPLLYLRARAGVTGIATDSLGVAQYDMRQVYPYTTALYTTKARGLINASGAGGSIASAGAGPFGGGLYLTDPNNVSSPRSKDKFIIISAGPDRIYGTPDDITTFLDVVPQ